MFKQVVFWCEFPKDVNWRKAEALLKGLKCEVYVASFSLQDYKMWKKKTKLDIYPWPLLSKEEGYWFSGFTNKEGIDQLKQYKGLKIINCDSTGTQDMGVDTLKAAIMRHRIAGLSIVGVNFTQHKDPMYKNLSRLMHDITMKETIIESAKVHFSTRQDIVKREKFIRQFLDLQKDIRNNKWACFHPEGPQYHDDYCDSLALACYFFKPLSMPHDRRFLIG